MSNWYPGSSYSYKEYLERERLLDDVEDRVKKIGSEVANQSGLEIETVNRSIYDVENQLSTLNANFNYTMGLLIKQVAWQGDVVAGLVDKIDKINDIISSPTLNQAREYYCIGKSNFDKGLLKEALKFFLKAESENSADFFTQSMLGTLYLYGVNADDNVVDPARAEHHFRLAARYAKAEKKLDENFTKLEAESLFNASVAIYTQLDDNIVMSAREKFREMLIEARNLAGQAANIHPDGGLLEAEYHVAKYSALLVEPQHAIPVLKKVIIANRDYKKKAEEDPAFEPVREYVTTTISNLRKSRKNESQRLLELNELFCDFFLRIGLDNSINYKESFSMFSNDVDRAKRLIVNDNYFGFLEAIEILEDLLARIPDLVTLRFDELQAPISETLEFIESIKPKGNTYSSEAKQNLEEVERLVARINSNLKNAGTSGEIKYRINNFIVRIRSIPIPHGSTDSPSEQTLIEITQVENRYDYMTEKSDVHKFLELVYQEGFLLLKDANDLAHLASEKATEAELATRQNLAVEREIYDFVYECKHRYNWRGINVDPSYEQLYSLIPKIKGLLRKDTNEALIEASGLMQDAKKLERILLKKINIKSRARKANHASQEFAQKYALVMGKICGGVGAVVFGFSGCISCLGKSGTKYTGLLKTFWYTDYNLFSGLFLGGLGGFVVGLLLGALWGAIWGQIEE